MALMHSTTAGLNTESRSKTRYRGAVSYGNASRSCCITQADVGWNVALKRTMWRRPCSITKKPYSSRSDAVGTVNKSIAAMSSLWFRKNATHRFTWSGSAGSHGMYRDTVFSEMMKPSFVSSAWRRGAPQPSCSHQPDEAMDLGVDARSPRMPALGHPRPVSPALIPMPPGYCLRVDDEEATRPPGPRLSKCDPERSVEVVEPWAGPLFLQCCHLLSQSEVFDHKVGPAPTQRSQRTGSERDDENEYTHHDGGVLAFFGPELKRVVSP